MKKTCGREIGHAAAAADAARAFWRRPLWRWSSPLVEWASGGEASDGRQWR